MRVRGNDIQRYLEDLIRAGISSSAAALVGTPEKIEWEGAAGEARAGIPATTSTVFDFASLTKPLVGTLAIHLDAEGLLPLSLPIGEVWPAANRKLAKKTLESLLRHRSGIMAYAPLYHLCRSREDVLALLLDERWTGARVGTYSDLGYLLWQLSAERRLGEPLSDLLRSRVLLPLGLSDVLPSPGDRPEVAESRMDTGMEARLAALRGLTVDILPPPPIGLPQDGNARFMHRLGAGLTAHSGLFGRLRDLWRLGAEWLEPAKVLKPEDVSAALAGGGPFALGWWRRTLKGSAGKALDPASFGHTGFAGGSLWIDPEKRRIAVLLSHRIGPFSDMNRWRRRFHSVALAPRRG